MDASRFDTSTPGSNPAPGQQQGLEPDLLQTPTNAQPGTLHVPGRTDQAVNVYKHNGGFVVVLARPPQPGARAEGWRPLPPAAAQLPSTARAESRAQPPPAAPPAAPPGLPTGDGQPPAAQPADLPAAQPAPS